MQPQPNRLIHEQSPYLQQHAYNPVDWYPWGKEAFDKAKEEGKPIFLSIGYSTCHWCHAMAHDTFENEEIAKILNDNYVPIKVDREERPDIDSAYMSACQAMTGQGGWPMTILTTEEGKPFFAATYFPPHRTEQMPGMDEVLGYFSHMWTEQKQELRNAGEEVQMQLRQETLANPPKEPDKNLVHKAFSQLEKSFDAQNGGFHRAPKFPIAHQLLFLMEYAQKHGNSKAMEMVEITMEQMYRGGIFDHIGGGFSRYSTDKQWLVPHFEKMLYDNALLTIAYAQAYMQTKNPFYEMVVRKTLGYVLRELTAPQGGFYCGQDADSEGVEGKYYVWTVKELTDLLGQEDAKTFCNWFSITEQGNFEGKNIPNLLQNPKFAEPNQQIDELSKKAYAYRLHRTKLHRDEKILLSWNGLMIAALAKAYEVTKEISYLSAAVKAEQWLSEQFEEKSRFLDDYAFFAYGILTLYQVTGENSYLGKAERMAAEMLNLFFDREKGGFYLSSEEEESLFLRPREMFDGALPSGNSVAAYVLKCLGEETEKPSWKHAFQLQQHYLTGNIEEFPINHCFALLTFFE